MDAGSSCDSTRSIVQPSSPSNLYRERVGKQEAANQAPDWALIIGLLAFLAFCIIMLVIAVIVWRPRNAGIYPMRMWKPKYRTLGAPPQIPPYLQHSEYEKDDVLLGPRIVEGAESIKPGTGELENFNVRTLFDKLEDQTLYLSQQLARQQEDLRGFYERMGQQTDGLKDLLMGLDLSKLDTSGKGGKSKRQRRGKGSNSFSSSSSLSSDEDERDVKESEQKTYKISGAAARESELMAALQLLLEKLNAGKIPLSPEMLKQKAGNAMGVSTTGMQVTSGKGAAVDNLLKRQNGERTQLDQDLREDEDKELDKLLQEHEYKRQQSLQRMSSKLANQLEDAETSEEIERIMGGHEKEMAQVLEKLDVQRQRQTEDLLKRLAAKRKAQVDLMRARHKQEAEQAGLPVPALDEINASEQLLDQELTLNILLAEEATDRAKDLTRQNAKMAQDQQQKMSENLTQAMENLSSMGSLSSDATQDALNEQQDLEKAVKDKMEARRRNLTDAMKKRMAERKKKKVRKLKQQHEAELEQLGTDVDDAVLKEVEARHKKELEALDARLAVEEAEHLKEIEKQIDEEHTKEMQRIHRQVMDNLSKKHSVDPVLQQQILDQMRRQNEAIAHELAAQKDRQEADLQAKLAARRSKKQQEARRVAEEATAQRILTEQEKIVGKDSSDGFEGLQEMSPAKIAELSMEEQAVIREHQRVQEEMKERQQEDKKAMEEKLNKEAKMKEAEEMKRLERERTKVLSEKRNKQAAELAARQDLSEDEMRQLMATHARELEELEDKLDSERQRQQLAVRERLAERKKRLLADQKRKQKVELAKELLEQKKELGEVRSNVVKQAERKEMVEGIQEQGAGNAEKIIRSVLEKRQAQELEDLHSQFAAERQVAVEGELTKLNDKFNAHRDAMLQRHERELSDLSKEDLSSEERRQRKAALLNQQQLELNKLEKELANEKRAIQQGALSDWELRYAKAKLELKERHYQEYANALKELSDQQDSDQIINAEQAAKAAQELEDMKEKLEKERLANEEKIRKEKEEFEAEQKHRLEQELSEFERELAADEKKERERNEKRMSGLSKRKEEMIKEKRQKQEDKIKQMRKGGSNKAETDRLMEEFEKDLAKMSNKMDADRMRMQADLEARLKKKREEKRNAKKEQVEAQMEENKADMMEKFHMEEEKIKREEVQALKECIETDHLLSDDAPKIAYSGYQQSGAPEAQFPAAYASVAPLSDEDLTALLMASPLYKKLGDIKKTMEGAELPPRKRDQGEPFLDDRDAEWTEDTELKPTDLNKLNPRNFVIYKFGCFIIKMVSCSCDYTPVTLLLADKVPANPSLIRNAYRNSYHYDDRNRILYMRKERMDRVGDFVLVLVHALAHIKTGDMRDDSLAVFVQEFHNALSVVCNDLFFARYRHRPETSKDTDQTAEKVDNAAKMLLDSITGDTSEREKEESVTAVLDVKLMKGADADGVHMTEEALMDRLSQYNNFAVNDQMKTFLGRTEDKMVLARQHGSSDEIDKRLATLTGSTAPSVRAFGMPNKTSVDQLPGELSGTALWQNAVHQTTAKEYAGGRVWLALQKAKEMDLQKYFLQDEVSKLEDKVDNLSGEFSSLSSQVVATQDKICDLQQQLQSQRQLEQDGDKKAALIRDTSSKLSDSQSQLTSLSLKRDTISKKLDVFKEQLEEKQQELQSYLRKAERSKKPSAPPPVQKRDSTVAEKKKKPKKK